MQTPISPVSVQNVTSLSEFLTLKKDWNHVVHSSPDSGIYLDHVWIANWWVAFGQNQQVHCLIFYDDNGPMGIAPFMLDQVKFSHISINMLRLIGNDTSPRSNILFLRHESEGLNYIDTYIKKLSWNFFDFGWEKDSLTRQKLSSSTFFSSSQCCRLLELPIVYIDKDWDGWLANKARTFRKTIRKTAKKCEHFTVRNFPEDYTSISELLEQIEKVATHSWSHEENTSLISNQDEKLFYQNILNAYQQEKQVYAAVLFDKNEPIGYSFGISHLQTIYGLKTAYKKQYHDLSAGTQVMAAFIKMIMNRGFKFLDMDCMTSHSEYKRRWANEIIDIRCERYFSQRIVSRLLCLAYTYKNKQLNQKASQILLN